MSVSFSDDLQESGTQQDVAPEPADHKDKTKSKGKRDQTQGQAHTHLNPRGKRRVSYDRTGRWYYPAGLANAALFQIILWSCARMLDSGSRGNSLTGFCVWLLEQLFTVFVKT